MNKRKKDFDQVIAYYLPARELVTLDVCATRLYGGTDCRLLVVSAAFILGGVVCHRDTPVMKILLDAQEKGI